MTELAIRADGFTRSPPKGSNPDTRILLFDELLVSLAEACGAVYGDRLVNLAVFGSVGRDVCPGWTSSTGSRSG